MLDSIAYSVRRHAFEKERRWNVDDTGLAWQAEDASGRLDYADIASIRLDYGATRADFARFRCHVTGRTGAYTIVSTHFDGPGSFSDRRDTYAPFVRALIARTSAANPQCRFFAGVGPAQFWGTALLLFVSLAVLAIAVFSLGVPALWYLYLKIAVLIVLLPVAFVWIKRNRPRRFQPSAIPADILPGG
jgi:hypothetical protein